MVRHPTSSFNKKNDLNEERIWGQPPIFSTNSESVPRSPNRTSPVLLGIFQIREGRDLILI